MERGEREPEGRGDVGELDLSNGVDAREDGCGRLRISFVRLRKRRSTSDAPPTMARKVV